MTNDIILNFQNQNNFIFDDEEIENINKETIEIITKKRNAKKIITQLKGLNSDYNKKALLSEFKKLFSCNGSLVEDKDNEIFIQLNGNHKLLLNNFLIENNIATKDQIKLRGF